MGIFSRQPDNLHVIPTDAAGSYCDAESGRHVDVANGLTATLAINNAYDNGSDVIDWDEAAKTPDSKHGMFATTPDDCGADSHRPARHGCKSN